MAAAIWAQSASQTRQLTCVSHTTAAWIHGLLDDDGTTHLTSPRSLTSKVALSLHRMSLEPVDITRTKQIPVTTVARTLFDLGAVAPFPVVESALETALRRGLGGLARLRWQLDRCGGEGKRGAKTLRRLLDERAKGYIPSESELELRFFRILSAARLPLPVRQKVFKEGGRAIARVDFAYPSHNLVIEVYGWRFHGGKAAWQRDHSRANTLVLGGQRVLVFTWDDITRQSQRVGREVARALGVSHLFR